MCRYRGLGRMKEYDEDICYMFLIPICDAYFEAKKGRAMLRSTTQPCLPFDLLAYILHTYCSYTKSAQQTQTQHGGFRFHNLPLP
jgi:hypothetical protein